MEEVTNSEAPVEVTPEESSAEVTETTTETTERSPKDDSGLDLKYDLSEIPEEQREAVERYVKKYERDFKGAYTRKTQSISENERRRDQEVTRLQGEIDGLRNVAKEVLQDPSKLEAYRQVYGAQFGVGKQEEIPKFQYVEDMVKYYDDKIKNLTDTLQDKIDMQTEEKIRAYKQKEQWNSALKSKLKDPKFKKWEKIVTKLALSDPKYKGMYDGTNEEEILDAAFEDFKEMQREDMNEVKQSNLASMEKKKSASTVTPKKTVTTQTPGKKLSPEEIIARVERRLGG